MGSRRRWIALIAALVIGWAGLRWWRGRDDGGSNNGSDDNRPAPVARRYQNGQWVSVSADGDQLWDALRKVRNRPAGLWQVSGTIRDLDTRAPIPGAEMILAGPLGENSATADDEGHYEMFVPPGLYRTFARADGYIAVGDVPIQRVPETPDATSIGLPAGHIAPALLVDRDTYGVDITLAGAAEIFGTVFDAGGYPIPEVLVVAEQSARNSSGIARPVSGSHIDETDLDGAYSVIVPAGFIHLSANHIDYAGVERNSSRFLSAGDKVRMDLTLSRGCIISGTVVDSDGYRVDEGSLERWTGGLPPNDFAPATRIDHNGDFRLALTETGDVTLRAWPWKSAPSHPQRFSCHDGALYEQVLLVAQDADADLEGRVVDADGEPIEYAFVDILPMEAGGMEQQERADQYGEFKVFMLPEADYRVQAYVPGKGFGVEIASTPSRGVTVQLGGTGSLTGRVLGMDEGSFTMVVKSCAVTDIDGGVFAQLDDVTMPDIEMLVPVSAGEFRVDGLPTCTISGRIVAPARTAYFRAAVPAGGVGQMDEVDLRAPEDRVEFSGNTPPPRW
jgi:hypothetical protein